MPGRITPLKAVTAAMAALLLNHDPGTDRVISGSATITATLITAANFRKASGRTLATCSKRFSRKTITAALPGPPRKTGSRDPGLILPGARSFQVDSGITSGTPFRTFLSRITHETGAAAIPGTMPGPNQRTALMTFSRSRKRSWRRYCVNTRSRKRKWRRCCARTRSRKRNWKRCCARTRSRKRNWRRCCARTRSRKRNWRRCCTRTRSQKRSWRNCCAKAMKRYGATLTK